MRIQAFFTPCQNLRLKYYTTVRISGGCAAKAFKFQPYFSTEAIFYTSFSTKLLTEEICTPLLLKNFKRALICIFCPKNNY